MKKFINSLRPNHPFFETLNEGNTLRFNLSFKKNLWINYHKDIKRIVISLGK